MSSAARGSLLPDIVLILVAALWGGSYLGAKELAAVSSAPAVMCARFLPSAVLLIVVCVALGATRRIRAAVIPGSVLGILRTATIALETVGVTATSATNAGLIMGFSVLITPVLESVLTHRRLGWSFIGSIALALVGIAAVVAGNGLAAPRLGDLLVLTAALTRALLGIAESRVTIRPDAPVLQLTTIEICLGAVVFVAAGGRSLTRSIPSFAARDWMGVAYLSLGCTVLAFLATLWATKHTSASRASMLLGTEPGWALLIGVAVAGDAIGPVGVIGAIAIDVATFWGRRAELRWRAHQWQDAARMAHPVPDPSRARICKTSGHATHRLKSSVHRCH